MFSLYENEYSVIPEMTFFCSPKNGLVLYFCDDEFYCHRMELGDFNNQNRQNV